LVVCCFNNIIDRYIIMAEWSRTYTFGQSIALRRVYLK
jgi:hypothetical protein